MEEQPRRRRRRIVEDDDQDAPVVAAPEREPMRQDMRELDSRTLAERRAAEILANERGDIDTMDEFYFDPANVPDGWSYEWKRKLILGAEDPSYQVQLAQQGWTAVPAKRHPEMMPSTGTYETIERRGMVLMERPKVITDRARGLELRRARDQVRVKETQLNSAPPGTFDRGTHPGAPVKINKSYETIPIPNE